MVTFDICAGNPGAFTFLMEAYNLHAGKAECAFQKMQNAGITGSKLYMIWNDCCDRDTDKAVDMMLKEDIGTIIKYINYDAGRGLPYSN